MSDFLFVYRPSRLEMLTEGPNEAEQTAVAAHFQYLTQLHEKGDLAFAGRTQDAGPDTVGLAVVHADSLNEAQTLLDHDPAVAQGVFVGTCQPYAFAIGSVGSKQS